MSGRNGRKPATFDPACLAALGFADDGDEMPSGEVAELLGVHLRTVSRWCLAGELPGRKAAVSRAGTDGIYLIRVADLRAFVAARLAVSS